MGSVKDNGGKREGAGRKPKADEDKLIQKLSQLDDKAFKCLEDGIKSGNYQYWNKFMEFRYGKPKERVDVTTGGETLNIPIINFVKSGS
jgi:hypothetical protein